MNDQRLSSLPLYIVSVTSIGIVLFSAFLMFCVCISILFIRIELSDANSLVGLGKKRFNYCVMRNGVLMGSV